MQGNNPPVILARAGLRRLAMGGPILGGFRDPSFEEETVALSAGDTMVMFSDGVTEARDPQEREFGEERLIACVAAGSGQTVEEVLRRILNAVQEFCQGTPQGDDITAAVAQFRE